jgi:hypothetical protein
MPVASAISRSDMIIVVKIAPMVMGALFLMVFLARMARGGSRLLSLDQMDVRTMIAMMLVEKGSKAFPRCSRVKEKFSTRTAARKCGAPPPCSRDLSHTAHRQCAVYRSRRLLTSGGLNKKAIFDLQVLEFSRQMTDRIQERPTANSSLPPSVTQVACSG